MFVFVEKLPSESFTGRPAALSVKSPGMVVDEVLRSRGVLFRTMRSCALEKP